MLLFEGELSVDIQNLLISQIDGLLPLFVSGDTLSCLLDLIITRGIRVMIVGDAKHSRVKWDESEEPQSPGGEADKCLSSAVGDEAVPIATDSRPRTRLEANDPGSSRATVVHNALANVSSVRSSGLSEREGQILDGLVKGHPNKVIARTFDISEATVKVHMKSILRKIRVANRTQAAIWALENGYSADEVASTLQADEALAQQGLG